MFSTDQLSHENKRFSALESTLVTSTNTDGTLDMVTGGRSATRTEVGLSTGLVLGAGDRALVLTGAENGLPETIGQSTWIT